MRTRQHPALHWKDIHRSLLPISMSGKFSGDPHVGNTPQTSVMGEGEQRWSLVGWAKATEWKKRRGKVKLMPHYSALGGPRWQIGCQSSTSWTFLTVTKTLQTIQTPFCNFLKTSQLIQTVEMFYHRPRCGGDPEWILFDSNYTSVTSLLLSLTASFPDQDAAFLQRDCGCPRTPRKRQSHTGRLGTFQTEAHDSSWRRAMSGKLITAREFFIRKLNPRANSKAPQSRICSSKGGLSSCGHWPKSFMAHG